MASENPGSASTRVGVGACDDPDSTAAGAAAAREAVDSGGLDLVDFARLFATRRPAPERLLDGVRRELCQGLDEQADGMDSIRSPSRSEYYS